MLAFTRFPEAGASEQGTSSSDSSNSSDSKSSNGSGDSSNSSRDSSHSSQRAGRRAIFDAWAHDLQLTARDRRSLQRTLEGSADQGALLDALDGPIDEAHAQRFAAASLHAKAQVIGPARTRALVARAAQDG